METKIQRKTQREKKRVQTDWWKQRYRERRRESVYKLTGGNKDTEKDAEREKESTN